MGRMGLARVKRKPAFRSNRLVAFVAAGSIALASLPTAGFALGALERSAQMPTAGFAALTPASGDPQLAEFVAQRSGNTRLIRFTPAGAGARVDRAVTVAVRVDEDSVRAISVRSAIDAAREQVAADAGVRIAPTRYNLGISRGYQNFAKATPALSHTLSDAAIPDLADLLPSPEAREGRSRFAARIAPADDARSASPIGEQAVDLAGSYRLTRNLDVTAGVRYSQDRDRLTPLPDSSKQDSQAVYVGTQFRF